MKRIVSLILSVLFLLFFAPQPAAASPAVSAESFCLLDAHTGESLYSHAENKPLPMASTTKIMTALVVLENADVYQKVEIPPAAIGAEGSSMYLFPGEKLTVLDLLYGLLLESANDAANALALLCAGAIPAFAQKMNERAQSIGMLNSNFVNPSGLPVEGHLSSARDLALLLAEAMKNELFCLITSEKEKRIEYKPGAYQTLINHNRLLRSYPYCTGGKTGYTLAAGRCLVTAAEKDGKRLIAATLNDPADWADHKALFEYGFSLFEKKEILPGDFVRAVPVAGGAGNAALFSNPEAVSFFVKTGEEYSIEILSPPFLYAPIFKGEILFASVRQGGRELRRFSLTAQNEVPYLHTPSFWERFCLSLKRMLS